ncbi:MAG: cyclic nucleotide-binding domain-containing protein [Dinoroseobacter sp.]|nr:cyclic nucleotide-binding domain-containing protein [Dinoroseobacter sp.]
MSSVLAACAALPELSFEPGTPLISEGKPVSRLFILVSGRVSVRKGDKEVARISDEGAIFGEMSALLDIPASASVIALDDVRALCAEDGAALIEANHQLAIHTARTLAKRLYHATAYLADCKTQFADRSDHFGIMDQILDELLQQQRAEPADTSEDRNDPRL